MKNSLFVASVCILFVVGSSFVSAEHEIDLSGLTVCRDGTYMAVNGLMTHGSTELSTVKHEAKCGATYESRSPGTWFWVIGTGHTMRASTCNAFTTFDTQISIYRSSANDASGCDTLACVDGNDNAASGICGVGSNNGGSTVHWNSNLDEIYYILVHGKHETSKGNFGLSIFDAPPAPGDAPSNDKCFSASLMTTDGMPLYGSTTFATPPAQEEKVAKEIISNLCGSAMELSSPGVWYQVIGTGERMRIHTCDPATNFDTQLSVFSGDCSTLECVDGDNNSCDENMSSVTFQSEDLKVYTILVHGTSQFTAGNFGIRAEVLPGVNDNPNNNEQTANALSTVSHQKDETQDSLNKDHIVHNDNCEDALVYPGNTWGSWISSTVSASYDANVGSCGDATAPNSPGVWFKVEGTGDSIAARTCDSTLMDTQISVFSGDHCSALTCVVGNDNACGLQSSVEWNSQAGTMYYVLVHGGGSTSGQSGGDFALYLGRPPYMSLGVSQNEYHDALTFEKNLLSNDRCGGAIPIPVGGRLIGDNNQATIDKKIEKCGSATESRTPGLWYAVIGNGHRLEVTTGSVCHDFTDIYHHSSTTIGSTNFDTQISLFEGNCGVGLLNCIDGNDDDDSKECGSTVVWDSTLHRKYFILVHGYPGEHSVGDFTISVTDLDELYVQVGDTTTNQQHSNAANGNNGRGGRRTTTILVILLLVTFCLVAFIGILFMVHRKHEKNSQKKMSVTAAEHRHDSIAIDRATGLITISPADSSKIVSDSTDTTPGEDMDVIEIAAPEGSCSVVNSDCIDIIDIDGSGRIEI